MNTYNNNSANINATATSSRNKMTAMSVASIALGIGSLYTRFQQVDTMSSVSMFLLVLGSCLLALGVILFASRPSAVVATKSFTFRMPTKGQLKTVLFFSLIVGYMVLSHIMGNLVTILN